MHPKLSFGFPNLVPTSPGNTSKFLLHGLSMLSPPSYCLFEMQLSHEVHSQFSQTHLPVHLLVYLIIGMDLEDPILHLPVY